MHQSTLLEEQLAAARCCGIRHDQTQREKDDDTHTNSAAVLLDCCNIETTYMRHMCADTLEFVDVALV